MSQTFSQGYALLVGADSVQDPDLAGHQVPRIAQDVTQLAQVLTDPNLCGYDPSRVQTLTGTQATKANILSAIQTLSILVSQGGSNATAFVYIATHSFQISISGEIRYYFVPRDTNISDRVAQMNSTAIRDEELRDALSAIPSSQVIVCVDGAPADSIMAGISGPISLPEPLERTPADGKPIPPFPINIASRFEELNWGVDRAVLLSSKDTEPSYPFGGRGLFASALIDVLSGNTGHGSESGHIYLSAVAAHVVQTVPPLATALGRAQNPISMLGGQNFPIALYKGGVEGTS